MLFEEVFPRMREGVVVRRPGSFITSYYTIAARYGSERLIATHRLNGEWYTVQSFESTWLDNSWEIHQEDQLPAGKFK